MLHQYLLANRARLIDRCRRKVAQRTAPKATPAELEHGVPLFLDQLIKTLKMEQTSPRGDSRAVSGTAEGKHAGADPIPSEIGESAKLHGRELLEQGFTIDQVVHDYGDVCQAITDLAYEEREIVEVDEFRTLNRCLDNAIAGAVTEYSAHRDAVIVEKAVEDERDLGPDVASDMRDRIKTASLAIAAIRSGRVGVSGSTGALLDKCMAELSALIDRAFAAALPADAQSRSKRAH
jgi:hypothetical protein